MKDKIKYYLLLLAFLFIMALILWFFHDWIDSLVRKVGFTTQGNTHVFCLLFERR